MRIRVTLEPEGELAVPIHYGSLIQGLIYRQIDTALASWLHEEAYATPSRRFRLFTFSRLVSAGSGRYRLENGRIRFSGPVAFTLASVNTGVLCSLAEHLLKSPRVQLGHHNATVRGIEVLKKPELDFGKPVRVRALSPITTYQTLVHPGGGKKTYFYSPFEREWHALLRNNLARKAKALGWEDDAQQTLKDATFRPIRVNQKDQKIITYKGTVIKGWLGNYEVSGVPEAYFELAYDAGLGAKNSQGFGLVEVIPTKR